MFKTIIATCLLTFSCSSGSLKIEHPRREYVPNATISGFYTFNNVFDFNTYEDRVLNFGEEYDLICYVYREDASYTPAVLPMMCTELNLSISVNSYVEFSVHYTVATGYDDGNYNVLYETTMIQCTLPEFSTQLEGYNDPRFVSSDLFTKNFMVYFPKAIVLYGQELDTFQRFFNSNGNMYTNRYNGWFTYRTGYWHNANLLYELEDMTFLVENQMYTSLVHQDSIVQYTGVTIATGNLIQYDVWYAPSTYVVSSPIHFYSMLPYSVRENLSTEGVFDYIQTGYETTWYEMILSVMDAPIYYITQLFGFDLFGISLFVALSSLLTLLLIVTIIKKVV